MAEPGEENQEQVEAPLEFPLTWPDECPVCGTTRLVANSVKQEEVAKGKWNPTTPAVLLQPQSPMVDPLSLAVVMQAPMLVSQWDTCVKCGIVRSLVVERGDGPVQFKQRPA